MKCLKTGFHFGHGELNHASDMYLGDDNSITIVANRVGYLNDGSPSANAITQVLAELAPRVHVVLMNFGDEYQQFHAEWNSDVPLAQLDKPVLVVYR